MPVICYLLSARSVNYIHTRKKHVSMRLSYTIKLMCDA